jgi:5-methylcytosine-specific restriction endonuclease McrA
MSNKKKIRQNFRDSCLKRDKYSCVICGKKANSEKEALSIFDVHHITDRNEMPNGGYVLENGITLCHDDHIKAEKYHSTGIAIIGFSPDDLYLKIKSSLSKAKDASEK